MNVPAIKNHLHAFLKTINDSFPNYEERPAQSQMIRLILNGIYKEKHVLVEAGTGTGKSLAYLLAVLALLAAGEEKRTIISTHTINLQEQLLKKDIPMLQELLKPFLTFKSALAKGRSNYVCKRRFLELLQERTSAFESLALVNEFDNVRTMIYHNDDFLLGDRSELKISVSSELWSLFASHHETCLERRCPLYKECFFRAARDQLAEADIIVSNHALFFTDLSIRGTAENEEGILPPYDYVIFDEAHHLEDVSSAALSLRVDGYKMKNLGGLFRSLYNKGTFKEHLVNEPEFSQEIENTMRVYFEHIDDFLRDLQTASKGQGTKRLVPKADAPLENLFTQDLENILKVCARLSLLDLSDDEEALLEKASSQWKRLREELEFVLGVNDESYVYWIESTRQDFSFATMQACPIEMSATLSTSLFAHVQTVLTSATLATPSLNYTAQRLGVDNFLGKVLESPFDHQSHVAVYTPKEAVEPSYQNNANYEAYVSRLVSDCVKLVDGGSFVLFTSYQMLNNVYEQIEDEMREAGIVIFKQGELPRHELLKQYTKEENAVLLATSSFWEGVDVAGAALRTVMITKLPFAVPDHPLTAARMEAVEAAGHNPFMSYQLPQAIIRLKQGYGRLIRSQEDRGIVVIADPRVHTKRYGGAFLEALPSKNIIRELAALEDFVTNCGIGRVQTDL